MSTRLAQAQGVVLQRRGGEQLLVNTNTGSRCTLNALGRRIWSVLASRPTFPALVSRVAGAYGHSHVVAHDAGRLVVAWREAGLIIWTNR